MTSSQQRQLSKLIGIHKSTRLPGSVHRVLGYGLAVSVLMLFAGPVDHLEVEVNQLFLPARDLSFWLFKRLKPLQSLVVGSDYEGFAF